MGRPDQGHLLSLGFGQVASSPTVRTRLSGRMRVQPVQEPWALQQGRIPQGRAARSTTGERGRKRTGEDQSRERGERDASRKGVEVEVGESRGEGLRNVNFPSAGTVCL